MDLHTQIVIEAQNLKRSEWHLLELLSRLHEEKGYLKHKCDTLRDYIVSVVRLSPHIANDLATVAVHVKAVPALVDVLKSERTTLTKLRRICAVLTVENQAGWIALACECTSRVIERCVAIENGVLPKPSTRVSIGERVERAVQEIAEFEKLRKMRSVSTDDALIAMAKAYAEKYGLEIRFSGTCQKIGEGASYVEDGSGPEADENSVLSIHRQERLQLGIFSESEFEKNETKPPTC
jgi:hypothetical protein